MLNSEYRHFIFNIVSSNIAKYLKRLYISKPSNSPDFVPIAPHISGLFVFILTMVVLLSVYRNFLHIIQQKLRFFHHLYCHTF